MRFFFFFLSPDDLGFFSDFLAGVFLAGGMTVVLVLFGGRSTGTAILYYLSSTALQPPPVAAVAHRNGHFAHADASRRGFHDWMRLYNPTRLIRTLLIAWYHLVVRRHKVRDGISRPHLCEVIMRPTMRPSQHGYKRPYI